MELLDHGRLVNRGIRWGMAKTPAQMTDAAADAFVDILEGRIHGWQEADKRGEFHRADHMARAIKILHDISEDDIADAAACGVAFVC